MRHFQTLLVRHETDSRSSATLERIAYLSPKSKNFVWLEDASRIQGALQLSHHVDLRR